ncbi:ribonuclease H-like domain-containing protein [Anaerobutyricum soehngenii]|uniref:ribonuclease H-like domain-containing protein n=1 Tax=Anaerobutyricum soehngenii TaxID=105843 RepID=UPI003D7C10C4
MLTINKVFPEKTIPEKTDSFLFFDIETTGFSKDNTILYLIGCGYFIENGFQFIQWFNDDGTSEEEILLAFHDILKQKDWQLVTFNGNSFDIPYLKRHYELNELPCDIESFPSLDFYQFLKPFQSLFQMTHGKQKDWEHFLELYREDTYDGGQLIAVYKEYLMNKEEALLHNLLLHNEEDLLGMKYLLPLFSYRMLLSKNLSLIKVSPGEILFEKGTGSIAMSCKLPLALPKPLNFTTSVGSISTDKNDSSILIISLPYIEETLKHFFKDYRNYYYLPEEDRAVHKSVGCYVERKYRRAAKASTCYIKKEGIFLPIPKKQKHYGIQIERYPYQDSFPLYKREFKSPRSFAEFDNLFSDKNESLSIYLRDVIKELFIIHIQEINDLI